MCPVVGFGPWLGLGKPLVEILPPGQLRGFCPLLAWLGSAVLGYGPVLSFGLVGPLLPPVISFVARILPTLACAPLAKSVPRRLVGLIRLTRVTNGTCLWGAEAPYCWSANGRRAHASLLARILT
ncbi:hypothetical protein JHK84_057396 [Glycine max]|nr:hypothetical protein JHK84_057396 [Glycine max]